MGMHAQGRSLCNKSRRQRGHAYVGVQFARQACTELGADSCGVDALYVCEDLLACISVHALVLGGETAIA